MSKETLGDRPPSIEEVGKLINDKMFRWNFLYILDVSHRTIEFRGGAASISAQDVFVYFEGLLFFAKAAIQLGDPQKLQGVPAAGGPEWFIEQAPLEQAPSLYNSSFLDISFSGQEDNAFREPRPLRNLS